MSMHLIAIAESDAYLKWASWTLGALPSEWSAELRVIRTRIAPSESQTTSALEGTVFADTEVPRVSPREARAIVRAQEQTAVLLACTGPTIAALTVGSVRSRARPVLVSGLPGLGLPVHSRAIVARSLTDVFIVHSRREQDLYAAAFRAHGAPVRVVLSHLPFLEQCGDRSQGNRIVFAAQPSVPPHKEQRLEILRRLMYVGPPAPIVKLRGGKGDHMTHDEPWPYRDLWDQLVERGEADPGAVEFADGTTSSVLDRACCVATVSSTVALEAIVREIPVVIIDDFGVGPDMLNDVFVGSGLLGPLSKERIAAAAAPQPAWLAENYFHQGDDDEWFRSIVDLPEGPSGLSRLRLGVVRAAVRRVARFIRDGLLRS